MARILVAEDDPRVRALVRVTLESGGHEVVEAVDGQDGWERLQKEPAEMLVLDLNMPRLDGLGLCRKVRQSKDLKNLPILMLTVKAMVEDQVRGYDSGADEYMAKPFEASLLLARVKALLSRTSKKA
jgi:DNA-binding response OmpR family regulator